jgi:hypothetical protein
VRAIGVAARQLIADDAATDRANHGACGSVSVSSDSASKNRANPRARHGSNYSVGVLLLATGLGQSHRRKEASRGNAGG